MLEVANILRVCGATLPGGPQTMHSQCKAHGRQTVRSQDGSDLAYNHEPPLQDWERSDMRRVCDPRRIELLCAECHNALAPATGKTMHLEANRAQLSSVFS